MARYMAINLLQQSHGPWVEVQVRLLNLFFFFLYFVSSLTNLSELSLKFAMYTMLSVALCLYQVGNFPGASGFIFSGVCVFIFSSPPNTDELKNMLYYNYHNSNLRASEILGKERRRKEPWVTKGVLDLCDEWGDLKKKQYEAEGAKECREANRRIQKAV